MLNTICTYYVLHTMCTYYHKNRRFFLSWQLFTVMVYIEITPNYPKVSNERRDMVEISFTHTSYVNNTGKYCKKKYFFACKNFPETSIYTNNKI